jgi:hypothetical protein
MTAGWSRNYLPDAMSVIPEARLLFDNPYSQQIEYPDEDPLIRQRFESELAKRGLKSLTPDEAYADARFEWE